MTANEKLSLTWPVKVVLLSGLLVGTLDILSAFVDYNISTGKNPFIILRYISSGAFGEKAMTAGGIMYFMGLLFHYIIAFSFTILFFLIYPRLKLISFNPIITGVLYGLFIWTVMNVLVVPLAFSVPWQFKGLHTIKGMLILILLIALPLSFIARQYYNRISSFI